MTQIPTLFVCNDTAVLGSREHTPSAVGIVDLIALDYEGPDDLGELVVRRTRCHWLAPNLTDNQNLLYRVEHEALGPARPLWGPVVTECRDRLRVPPHLDHPWHATATFRRHWGQQAQPAPHPQQKSANHPTLQDLRRLGEPPSDLAARFQVARKTLAIHSTATGNSGQVAW